MTFKARLNTVNILLILALLAALLVPVLGAAVTSQSVAFNALFDSGTADNAHSATNQPVAIACGCGDPGGTGGCC